jgi:hypothetical protein
VERILKLKIMSVIQLIIVSLVLTVFSGCGSGMDTSIIPGTYIQYTELNHDEDSHTRIFDTLEIQNTGKVYRIARRYRTFKMVDGKAMEPEYRTRRWTGHYREKSETLLINESGRVISFYPESNAIMLGGVPYKKME